MAFILAIALGYFATTYFGKNNQPNQNFASNTTIDPHSPSENFANNSEVEGKGTVIKVLKDDQFGSRHQRFILRLDSGQTVLVSHNIDLAPRLEILNEDDTVVFKGVYISNNKGGAIHWTHRDPKGKHEDGWLKRNGKIYQ